MIVDVRYFVTVDWVGMESKNKSFDIDFLENEEELKQTLVEAMKREIPEDYSFKFIEFNDLHKFYRIVFSKGSIRSSIQMYLYLEPVLKKGNTFFRGIERMTFPLNHDILSYKKDA